MVGCDPYSWVSPVPAVLLRATRGQQVLAELRPPLPRRDGDGDNSPSAASPTITPTHTLLAVLISSTGQP